MEKPKISIIIPCYNTAHFLNKCLNSVWSQTYKNWECIIVNDGSPDNTKDIANNWVEKDNRFRLINKENKGLAAARNTGVKESTGDYIFHLDSDDYLHGKNALSYLVAPLENEEYDIVAGNFCDVKNGEYFKEQITNRPLDLEDNDIFNFFLKKEVKHNACNRLFKKSFLEKHQIHSPENIMMGEDQWFCFQAFFYCKKFYFIKEITYNYLRHQNSCTSERKDYSEDLIWIYRQMLNFYDKNKKTINKSLFYEYMEFMRLRISIEPFEFGFKQWKNNFKRINNIYKNSSISKNNLYLFNDITSWLYYKSEVLFREKSFRGLGIINKLKLYLCGFNENTGELLKK